MSDSDESDVAFRENEDIIVGKLSTMKNEKNIFSKEHDVMKKADDSEMNISINLENDFSSREAEIDSTLSFGNDRKTSMIDSEKSNNFNVSVMNDDFNSQCKMDIFKENDVIKETDSLETNSIAVNDILSNLLEVDSTLSHRNDAKISVIGSEDCKEQIDDDNNAGYEINVPASLNNDSSSSKISVNSVLSYRNEDSGIMEDDSNNKLDIITEEDKVQSACTSTENVDTSTSSPIGSEQDSGVIEDVPSEKLNLAMEEDTVPDEDQTAYKAANNDDSLIPVENELDLIKDIIEDSSEDEALLSHQTEAANEPNYEEPPLSPQEDELNENGDTFEREKQSRSSSKDLTLPYFKLPKPDLDEFLVETEKNLQVALPTPDTIMRKLDSPSFRTQRKKGIVPPKVFFDPKKTFTTIEDPKKAFITIDLDFDYSKLSKKDTSKNKVQIAEIENETSSKVVKNEYEKVVSSLNKDETDLPGIKRLALKEFLKKQIDQKRYEAFCHSKSLNKEDEEMEEEAFAEEEEAAITDDEDSGEEEEEATVTFENLNRKDGVEEESVSEKGTVEECDLNAEESDDESDDDFIGVRKAKKKFLVLEEDEDEDEDLPNKAKSSLEIERASLFKLKSTKGIRNGVESDDDDVKYVRDVGQCKNSQPAFREGDFQLHEKSNGLSQISSSMPSYQPGGGFNQEIVLEDSSDSNASLPSLSHLRGDGNEDSQDSFMQYQSEENILRKSPRNLFLESDNVLKKSVLSPKNDDNMHHIKLDDLPISQTDNDSDIFATNELADVCSGAFNGGDAEELAEVMDSQSNAGSGTTSLRRLEDVLKYPPKEKYEPEPESELEPEEKITDYFDIEAELSGEDDGVDEKDEDSEDDNLVLHPSDEEDLPEDEVLREEIADLHMKRIMNDDAEHLREIQEHFLDDGELNTDGAGRSRRFAWLNNDADIAPAGNNSDSDSDADAADDTFSSINEEKAKWRQENKDDENKDIIEELNSSGYRRKSFLKVNIIGKPKFSQEEDKVKRLSGKRPRGSFLNLDDGCASQVLKKLKASEDNMGGSRTTKHFVFRNELTDPEASGKENSMKSALKDSSGVSDSPKMCSIFNKI